MSIPTPPPSTGLQVEYIAIITVVCVVVAVFAICRIVVFVYCKCKKRRRSVEITSDSPLEPLLDNVQKQTYQTWSKPNTSPDAELPHAGPSITSHPVSLADVKPGSKVHFSVKATGTGRLSYQWQKDGVSLTDGGRIKGASTSTLSITAVQKSDEGGYACVVSNNDGTDTCTSVAATLTLATPPQVTSHPESLSDVVPGSGVQFSVTATGTAPLSYQWQKDGKIIKGASTSTLSITAVQKGDEGGYTCVVNNTAGTVISNAATVTLATPPQVTSHPVSLTDVKHGSDVQFTVTATGTEPLSYQWQKDGKDLTDGNSIRGTTTAKLSITAVQNGDEGGYTCVVSNTAGTVTSKPATLGLVTQAEVLTGKTWYLGNISYQEAVSRLMEDSERTNGSYVVYDHPDLDRENSFVLLVWWKGHVHKLSINEARSTDDEGREKVEYTPGEDVKQKKHSTVKALIKYHRGVTGVAIQLEDGTRITLKKSIARARAVPLEEKRWYHGNISHEEAESRLRRGCGGKDGTYLVYDNPSGREGSYKLPIYDQGEIIKELEINRIKHITDEGEKFGYVLGEGGPGAIVHSSVKELVKYHRGLTGVPIQLKDGRKVKLTENVYRK